MYKLTLFILAAVCVVALAEGQYYVPRAYYTIDAEGHESAHVPLRRLRRSLQPYPYQSSANANADANAYAGNGGSANANVKANAASRSNGGGDGQLPVSSQGTAKSGLLGPGQTRKLSESLLNASSVSASTSVGVNTGVASYDQSVSVAKEI